MRYVSFKMCIRDSSADGSVTAQGYTLTNNQITVPYGNGVTFTVTPAAGKQFQKAVFVDVTINSLSRCV